MENDPIDDVNTIIERNRRESITGCRSCLYAYGLHGCIPWSEDPGICTKCAVKQGSLFQNDQF